MLLWWFVRIQDMMCSLNVYCTSARPLRREIKTEECFYMIVFHQPVARMCATVTAFICLRFQWRHSQQPRQMKPEKTLSEREAHYCLYLTHPAGLFLLTDQDND